MNRVVLGFVSILMTLALSACGVLNSLVPDVDLEEGAFGLGGAQGTELSGTFTTPQAGLGSLAVGSFSLNKTFADLTDLQDDRIKGIQTLATKIGLAMYQNGVALKLANPGASYPETIKINTFTFELSLTDPSKKSFSIPKMSVPVSAVLSKAASCTNICNYSAVSADIASLISLFAISISGANGDTLLAILRGGGDNTLNVKVEIKVDNPESDFTGSTATIKLGETEAVVKVRAF